MKRFDTWENEGEQRAMLRAAAAEYTAYGPEERDCWVRGVMDALDALRPPIIRAHADEFRAFAEKAAQL